MPTPDLPHGISLCPQCQGKGYIESGSPGIPSSICNYCRGARHVVSWWPDAFVDRITLDGPLLVSAEESLALHRPPRDIIWKRATLSWSTIMCLSQGPFTNRVFCRLTENPLTTRDCGSGEVQTTYCHFIDGPPKLIGLPYQLMQRHWKAYLLDQEKRRHER